MSEIIVTNDSPSPAPTPEVSLPPDASAVPAVVLEKAIDQAAELATLKAEMTALEARLMSAIGEAEQRTGMTLDSLRERFAATEAEAEAEAETTTEPTTESIVEEVPAPAEVTTEATLPPRQALTGWRRVVFG